MLTALRLFTEDRTLFDQWSNDCDLGPAGPPAVPEDPTAVGLCVNKKESYV